MDMPLASKKSVAVLSIHAVMVTRPGSTFVTTGSTLVTPVARWPFAAVVAKSWRARPSSGSVATVVNFGVQSWPGFAIASSITFQYDR